MSSTARSIPFRTRSPYIDAAPVEETTAPTRTFLEHPAPATRTSRSGSARGALTLASEMPCDLDPRDGPLQTDLGRPELGLGDVIPVDLALRRPLRAAGALDVDLLRPLAGLREHADAIVEDLGE